MNENLHISPAGLALQKRYEKGPASTSPNGFAPKKYYCDAGKPTIGWGHVITSQEPHLHTAVFDLTAADHQLDLDNLPSEAGIKRLVKVELKQHEFDALICWALNVGMTNVAGSTLLRKLNAGDRRGAADEFPKWNKYTDPNCGCKRVAKGLVNRRADERAMFLGL